MESVKKNFIYNVIYQILLILLPLITAPYVSRTLGANSLGIYSYTNSIAYYFLLVAMLGISNHGNRSIAAIRNDKDKLSKVFSAIFSLQFITCSIAIIAYIIYTFLFCKENLLIVFLQLPYVASCIFDISWLFFGLEKFKITVTRNILIKLISVLCTFIFVRKPDDLWKYTLIMSLGTLFSQVYLWKYVKKYVSFKWVGWKEIFSNLKPVLILFIPVISYSIYKVMDKIMLGNMSDYIQVGYFQSAEKIINIPMGIITALGTVMLPRMSNIIAMGDKEKVKEYIRVSIKFVTIIASAIVFGLTGVSSVLAPVYFGEEFQECGGIIALLAVTVFFISWANVIRTQYLIPYHYDKVYLYSTIVGAVLNLIFNALLIPKYKAIGASIGTIIAEFSVMIIQVIAVRKKIKVIQYIFKYVPTIIIGVLMAILVGYLGIIMNKSIVTLIVQVFVGAIFYCSLAVLFLKITKDELWDMLIKTIKNILNRKKNRKQVVELK